MSAADATNRALAAGLLGGLHAAGVRTVCMCPGARNAPLVLAFDAAAAAFDVVPFCDERGAAFFALGRIRRDEAPAAVVTTSGTAAAGLLPAMLEARHSGLPLIAVTADRPRRMRGTGAPQTIDQPPLFTSAAAPVLDIDSPGQLAPLPASNGPVHINICFDEPLGGEPAPVAFPVAAGPRPVPWMDESAARTACGDFFARVRHPLVLVSSLDPRSAAALAPWLASLGCPLYLEAVSQLRGHPGLEARSLRSGERILQSAECYAACDGILRIGGVPTPRFWRELDRDPRPVLHAAPAPFPGLARPDPVVPLAQFLGNCSAFAPHGSGSEGLMQLDRTLSEGLEKLLDALPTAEASLVRALDGMLPENARILLGNSLPIREWDLASRRRNDRRTYFANRGVNGIDGLVSTALGLAGAGRPAAAVLGDLTALCDLGGLWPPACAHDDGITIAVINNGGGQIFERMFRNPSFLNAHALDFRRWAEMFGWSHVVLHSPEAPVAPAARRILEVRPDNEASRKFREAFDAMWSR